MPVGIAGGREAHVSSTASLQGQVAVITGAGKGIGRALVERLAVEGMSIGLIARTASDVEGAAQAARDAGVGVVAVAGDVGDRATVEGFLGQVETELGAVDLLVNNAARSASWTGEKFWEVDPDDWWSRVETNLRGPVLTCRTVLPGMVARGAGRIINMNSLAGAIALPMTDGAYPVSKSGLFRFTDQLASQLRGTGVVVLDLSPGQVATQPGSEAFTPPGGWTPVERICDLTVAVAQGRLDEWNGRFVHVLDDLEDLLARTDEVAAVDGRTLRLRAGWDGDPRV